MNRPRVSVIMPVYNAEKYLAVAIDSILNQTHKDYELLIVDDSSTDKSLEIASQYKQNDSRVILLKNMYEKGVAGAINTGLKHAKGEYIARADADDINRSYRFELQVKYLNSNQDIYILGGGYAPFNEDGHRIDIYHPSSHIEIAWKFISNSFLCHPTVMFRRKIYEEFGGYPNIEAEDYGYFSKIVRKYKCSNLKVILIDYRESLTNRSFSAADRLRESVKRIFLINFRYYMGNQEHSEMFYQYQSENVLEIKNVFVIDKMNRKILKKIMENYKLSYFNKELCNIYLKIIIGYLSKAYSAK